MVTTKQIKATLRDLGIRPNLHGFEYITDAIKIIVDDPNIKMTALYAIIARRRDTTPAAVERSMRQAVDKGVNIGDKTLYVQFFGRTYHPGDHITVSLFVHTLADHFKEED